VPVEIYVSELAARDVRGGNGNGAETVEAARLAAIDELVGMAAGAGFSSADLRRERSADLELEEVRFARRFGNEGAA
jgi:hypothetical protein